MGGSELIMAKCKICNKLIFYRFFCKDCFRDRVIIKESPELIKLKIEICKQIPFDYNPKHKNYNCPLCKKQFNAYHVFSSISRHLSFCKPFIKLIKLKNIK